MSEENNHSIFRTRYTLIQRVKDPQDKESWSEFVRYYQQYIYNILRAIRIPQSDAHELCQDIIVQLWKKMPVFSFDSDKGKFRSWLATVIRNSASSYLRTKARHERFLEAQDGEVLEQYLDENNPNGIDRVISQEWDNYISNLAWEAVQKRFKASVQKTFILHMNGKSYKEIAAACNMTEGAARTYISRIRKYLKEEVGRLNQDLF